MRDYNDKRGGRESVERKPIAKNRPRRESGGLFLAVGALAFACVFGAGFFTGWFVKGTRTVQPVVMAPAVKKEEPAPPAAPAKTEVPLTFYKTLPAGGKGVIGTGLNPKKPEAPAPGHAAQPAAPAAPPAASPAAESSGAADGTAAASAPAKPESSTRYVVQLASYRDKQEATAAQAKLTEKGTAAYLVESRVPDKGVWYRLRVGRRLTRAEAVELAAKYGKGAAVLAE